MDKRKHYEEMLINIHNMEFQALKDLKIEELEAILNKKEKEQIALAKNPNKFWYIKGMPPPREYKPKTSKWYGALIVAILFLVLIGFLIMFIVLAFLNN